MKNECMRGACKYKNLVWHKDTRKIPNRGQNNTMRVKDNKSKLNHCCPEACCPTHSKKWNLEKKKRPKQSGKGGKIKFQTLVNWINLLDPCITQNATQTLSSLHVFYTQRTAIVQSIVSFDHGEGVYDPNEGAFWGCLSFSHLQLCVFHDV